MLCYNQFITEGGGDMYLKKSTSSKTGRTQLSIVHGFRDKEGKVRQKTIQTLGYLDILEKDYVDPIAHFEQVAKQMDRARKEENSSISLSLSPTASLHAYSGESCHLSPYTQPLL